MIYILLIIIELVFLYLLSRKFFKLLSQKVFGVTKSKRFVMYLIAFVFLPGTFIHELSHLIFAKLLGVQTGEFSIWPSLQENGAKLGSVQVAKTDIIRKSLIGIAPLITGTAVIVGLIWLVVSQNLFNDYRVLSSIGLLIFQISNTMFSSKRDIEGIWLFAVLVIAIIIALLVLGLRINLEVDLTSVNLLLLIPIFIDLVLVLILNIL